MISRDAHPLSASYPVGPSALSYFARLSSYLCFLQLILTSFLFFVFPVLYTPNASNYRFPLFTSSLVSSMLASAPSTLDCPLSSLFSIDLAFRFSLAGFPFNFLAFQSLCVKHCNRAPFFSIITGIHRDIIV